MRKVRRVTKARRTGRVRTNPPRRGLYGTSTKTLTLKAPLYFFAVSGSMNDQTHAVLSSGDKVKVTWTPGIASGGAYLSRYGRMLGATITAEQGPVQFKNWPREWVELGGEVSNPGLPPRSTGITLTETIARAASQDAGNRSMREAGRAVWNEEDWNAATDEYERLAPSCQESSKVNPDLTFHQDDTLKRLRDKGFNYLAERIEESWRSGRRYDYGDTPLGGGFVQRGTLPKRFHKDVDLGNEHVVDNPRMEKRVLPPYQSSDKQLVWRYAKAHGIRVPNNLMTLPFDEWMEIRRSYYDAAVEWQRAINYPQDYGAEGPPLHGKYNPAVSGSQYRAAQAVLGGSSNIMPVHVARELVESTPPGMRSEWSRLNPDRRKLSAYKLAADYKARGMDKQRAWSEFVKDKDLRPGIDAPEFYNAYNAVEAKRLEEERPESRPTPYEDPETADYGKRVRVTSRIGRHSETREGTIYRVLKGSSGPVYEVDFGDGPQRIPGRDTVEYLNPYLTGPDDIILAREFVPRMAREGRVDDSGGRTLELVIRRIGLNESEALDLVSRAQAQAGGGPASGKNVADAWKEMLEEVGQAEWDQRHEHRWGVFEQSVKDLKRKNPSYRDDTYKVRFIRPDQVSELMNLYHLARVPLSGTGRDTPYERMLWASKEFSKAHPEVSPTGAYKDLDGLRSNWFGRNPGEETAKHFYAVLGGSNRLLKRQLADIHAAGGEAQFMMGTGSGHYSNSNYKISPFTPTMVSKVRSIGGRNLTYFDESHEKRLIPRKGNPERSNPATPSDTYKPVWLIQTYESGPNRRLKESTTSVYDFNSVQEARDFFRNSLWSSAVMRVRGGRIDPNEQGKVIERLPNVETRTNPAGVGPYFVMSDQLIRYGGPFDSASEAARYLRSHSIGDLGETLYVYRSEGSVAGSPSYVRVKIIPGGYPRSRSNPSGISADLYETFHGSPSTEELTITTPVHEHEHLATLGPIIHLEVRTPTNFMYSRKWDGKDDSTPFLCSSEDGRQLYIEGGDQAIDLHKIRMDTRRWLKDSMVIGEIRKITYRTGKSFDHHEEIDYFHKLGEVTKVRPVLIYDSRSKLMEISGGQYYIEIPDSGVSRGIIN